MDLVFGSLMLLAVSPFLYHVSLHGVSVPVRFFSSDKSMLRLRWVPALLFMVWIGFNAIFFGIWAVLPGDTIAMKPDSFLYALYYPCLMSMSVF